VSPLVCALFAVLLASPTPAEVRQRAKEIVSAGYQHDLPGEGAAERARGGADDPASDRLPATPRRRDELVHDDGQGPFGALGSIARMLMWALMGAVIVLGTLWLGRELAGYSADAGGKPDRDGDDGEREAPDRAVVERPLGDADELARRGQFGEAVHALLLRTLQELARRLPERLPPSLTSREILARVRLPDDARHALAALVGAVEVSHFGGVESAETDFQHCRSHFQRFADAYLRGAA